MKCSKFWSLAAGFDIKREMCATWRQWLRFNQFIVSFGQNGMRETGTWIQDIYRAKNIERFLIECRKTKTNVITRTNRRKKTPSRGNKRKKKPNCPCARKRGFYFATDWWRGEFWGSMKGRNKIQPMQSRTTFDTQMKIALFPNFKLKNLLLRNTAPSPLAAIFTFTHIYFLTLLTDIMLILVKSSPTPK